MDISELNETLNLVFQITMFVLPIAVALLTWFLRNYVKSAGAERSVAAIVKLSNAAIDFAEDLDNRGDLEKYLRMWNMPEDVLNLTSNGLKKLNLAGKWLEAELARNGIKMTDEEAQSWIAAEFQKRVGDIGRERKISERTAEAVDLLKALAQSGLIGLPADRADISLLASRVADWIITQVDLEETDPLRDQVLVELQTGMGVEPTPAVPPPQSPIEAKLTDLARQAVQYVQELKSSRELTLSEMDIAGAWVLTEVTKQGLPVTTEQIANAVRDAMAV
jgi:hypothetical protein